MGIAKYCLKQDTWYITCYSWPVRWNPTHMEEEQVRAS